MSWYYAENNERRGPIDDDAFQGLVASGAVRPETLVWKEGFADWIPYSQAATPGPSAFPAAFPGGGGTVCAQCGRSYSPEELVTLGGRLICASCKPLAVQHMMEGTGFSSGAVLEPEQFLADLRGAGGYQIEVGSIISRAWKIVMSDFWPFLGVTLLCYLIMMVSQAIPCLGYLAPCLVQGPILGGLFLYYLKKIRGQPAVVGDAFSGFSKPLYGKLALAGTVQFFSIVVLAAVLIGPAFAMNSQAFQNHNSAPPIGFLIWCFVAMLPIIWLSVSWVFAYPLIADKGLEFWPAMELSRKVINMKFFGWILLFLVNGLLAMAGMLCLCVGLLVVMPVTVCGMMVAYEDIFSRVRTPTS